MASVELSVVIPTLNGGELFERTLTAIRGQKTPRSFEIVVVDSGSVDGTVQRAQSAGARVLQIERSQFNHGATRDFAIHESRGRYVALSVQDAEPANADWLEALAQALDDVPDASGAYSRQIPRFGLNPILRDRLERWSASRTQRDVQRLPLERSFDSLSPWERLARVAFDNVSSCIRRSVWERYPFGQRRFGEDIGWATACIRRGEAIVFEPRSVVIHSHDSSVGYEFRRILADHRNLSELIGLETVPDWRALRRNTLHARESYYALIAKEPLAPARKAALRRWACRYAFAENLAQYLGARCTRERRSPSALAPLWRLIEHMLVRRV
ncbi:MAG: glycosyltransferase family 2 protein [Planctomycetota bacterium]